MPLSGICCRARLSRNCTRLCRCGQLRFFGALQQGRRRVWMAVVQLDLRLIHQSLRRGIVRVKCGKALTCCLELGRDFDQFGFLSLWRYALLAEGFEETVDSALGNVELRRDLVPLSIRLV
jgi:hypothetical protein